MSDSNSSFSKHLELCVSKYYGNLSFSKKQLNSKIYDVHLGTYQIFIDKYIKKIKSEAEAIHNKNYEKILKNISLKNDDLQQLNKIVTCREDGVIFKNGELIEKAFDILSDVSSQEEAIKILSLLEKVLLNSNTENIVAANNDALLEITKTRSSSIIRAHEWDLSKQPLIKYSVKDGCYQGGFSRYLDFHGIDSEYATREIANYTAKMVKRSREFATTDSQKHFLYTLFFENKYNLKDKNNKFEYYLKDNDRTGSKIALSDFCAMVEHEAIVNEEIISKSPFPHDYSISWSNHITIHGILSSIIQVERGKVENKVEKSAFLSFLEFLHEKNFGNSIIINYKDTGLISLIQKSLEKLSFFSCYKEKIKISETSDGTTMVFSTSSIEKSLGAICYKNDSNFKYLVSINKKFASARSLSLKTLTGLLERQNSKSEYTENELVLLLYIILSDEIIRQNEIEVELTEQNIINFCYRYLFIAFCNNKVLEKIPGLTTSSLNYIRHSLLINIVEHIDKTSNNIYIKLAYLQQNICITYNDKEFEEIKISKYAEEDETRPSYLKYNENIFYNISTFLTEMAKKNYHSEEKDIASTPMYIRKAAAKSKRKLDAILQGTNSNPHDNS